MPVPAVCCPNCRATLRPKADVTGREVSCPRCRGRFVAAAAPAPATDDTPAEPAPALVARPPAGPLPAACQALAAAALAGAAVPLALPALVADLAWALLLPPAVGAVAFALHPAVRRAGPRAAWGSAAVAALAAGAMGVGIWAVGESRQKAIQKAADGIRGSLSPRGDVAR